MAAEPVSDPDGQGARVWFRGGTVEVVAPGTPPPGALRSTLSVISPGTEIRHLLATRRGPDKPAGYMNLARTGDGLLMAPAPHGSWLLAEQPGAIRTDQGARVAALGRFQLMAALSLSWLPDVGDPLVIGSGPVAVGCVLELLRRGARTVRVLTGRTDRAVARLPAVRVVREVPPDSVDVVIEATGRRMDAALAAVAPTGILGLLGTPDPELSLPALPLHRKGVRLIGMHELVALDPDRHQRTYRQVTDWLAGRLDRAEFDAWCLVVPGEHAPELYQRLLRGQRPAEPVLMLDWAG